MQNNFISFLWVKNSLDLFFILNSNYEDAIGYLLDYACSFEISIQYEKQEILNKINKVIK